jgi:hypothetical protein
MGVGGSPHNDGIDVLAVNDGLAIERSIATEVSRKCLDSILVRVCNGDELRSTVGSNVGGVDFSDAACTENGNS